MAGFRTDKVHTDMTAYAPVCGPASPPGLLQSIASVGTAGQVLTSNGAGALPTMQDAASGGGGDWTTITSGSLPSASSFAVASGLGTAYSEYLFMLKDLSNTTNIVTLTVALSINAGSSYDANLQINGFIDDSDQYTSEHGTSFDIGVDIDASDDQNFFLHLTANKLASFKPLYLMMGGSGIETENGWGLGLCDETADIDGIQWSWSSGDFDAGTYLILGR